MARIQVFDETIPHNLIVQHIDNQGNLVETRRYRCDTPADHAEVLVREYILLPAETVRLVIDSAV